MSPIHVPDHYQDGTSPLHRMDPRVKLALTLATVIVIAALPRGAWLSYLTCLVTIGIAIGLSRVHPLLVLRRSLVAMPFALAAVSLVVTVPGTPLASLTLGHWTCTLTIEGAIAFASIMVKAWLSVLTATLLVTTTPFTDLVTAMRAFRIPEVLVSIVSFMYRYMNVIADEALRLHRARESRSAVSGSKSGGSLAWRAKVLGGMIGSLFLRSYERSERVHAAMLSRGFDGRVRATKTASLRRVDFVAMGFFAAYLLTVASLIVSARGP